MPACCALAALATLATLATLADAIDRRAVLGGAAFGGALGASFPNRKALVGVSGAALGGALGGLATTGAGAGGYASAAEPAGRGDDLFRKYTSGAKPTNDVVKTVNGMRWKRLGSTGVVVSEMGLGTQRWGSADFNAPDERLCHQMLDEAVDSGVNLVDTAMQYPIPSDLRRPEGLTEEIIGRWLAQDKSRREKLVIATKITGGGFINRRSIIASVDESLKRLQTDYIDVYLQHWPARYTPQSNWGQSLAYDRRSEDPFRMSFDEMVTVFGDLMRAGKIRGYGACNDNCFGLTSMHASAQRLGMPPPCTMQNDFSLVDRRAEENGLSEASSPLYCNAGFMGYNALAGGMLTGKYLEVPPGWDDPDGKRGQRSMQKPRGRMDDYGWGATLYRYQSGPAVRAIEEYKDIAARAGLSLTDLSLRWCRERSFLTTTLLGHTSIEQQRSNIKAFSAKDRLPADVMMAIDAVHMRNRLPIFSSDRVPRDFGGRGEIGERIP